MSAIFALITLFVILAIAVKVTQAVTKSGPRAPAESPQWVVVVLGGLIVFVVGFVILGLVLDS